MVIIIHNWGCKLHQNKITVIIGKLGSGKTLLLSLIGLKIANSYPEIKVISNYETSFSEYVPKVENMLRRKNCVMLYDEAITSLDSRKWKSEVNQLGSNMVLKSRKLNQSMYMTVQAFELLDIRIRRIVNTVINVRYSKSQRIIFVENLTNGTKYQIKLKDDSIFEIYNTKEVIKSTYATQRIEKDNRIKNKMKKHNQSIDEEFNMFR